MKKKIKKKKGAKTYFPILKPATHQYLNTFIPQSLFPLIWKISLRATFVE